MTFSDLWIVIVAVVSPFLVAAPIILLLWRAEARKFRRHLTEVDLCTGEIGPGRVQIEGTVQCKELVLAPLSGEQAVGFRLLVETYGKHGWSPSHDISVSRAFDVVRDDGVTAAVDPSDVAFMLKNETEEHKGFLGDLLAPTAERLHACVELKGALDWRSQRHHYRLLECRLVPGTRVLVDGHVEIVMSPDGEAGDYRQAPASPVFRTQDRMAPIVADCTRAELLGRVNRSVKNRRFIPSGLTARL